MREWSVGREWGRCWCDGGGCAASVGGGATGVRVWGRCWGERVDCGEGVGALLV